MLKDFYRNVVPEEARLHISALVHPIHNHRRLTKADVTDKATFSIRRFDELNVIFVHVTKTGGTAIAQALVGEQPYHYRAIDYRAMYGFRKYNKYFKFGFTRNPWDRLYSAWSYLRQGGWHEADKQWYQDNISQYATFEDFVMHYLDGETIYGHKHLWPQHVFLCKHNKIIVDYVGHFETLEYDFNCLKEKLGLHDKMLAPMNASKKDGIYQDVYTSEMIDKVGDLYRADCVLFGYDFNSSQYA